MRPFKIALRAWIINVLHPAEEIVSMNSRSRDCESKLSIPVLHFTVTGIFTESFIDLMQSATNFGLAMRQAPNSPDLTLSLGHPTLRLISSKPALSPNIAP